MEIDRSSILPFQTHPLTFHAPPQPRDRIPRGEIPHWKVFAVPHGPETYSIEVCWVLWTAPVNWAELALPALLRGFEYMRTLYPDREPMWGTISMRTGVRLYRERLPEVQPDPELGEAHHEGLRAVDQFWLDGRREWQPRDAGDLSVLRYWESLIPRNGDVEEITWDMEMTVTEPDPHQGVALGGRMKLWEERTGLRPGLNTNIWWDWMPGY